MSEILDILVEIIAFLGLTIISIFLFIIIIVLIKALLDFLFKGGKDGKN